jgi:hypothetical protein
VPLRVLLQPVAVAVAVAFVDTSAASVVATASTVHVQLTG